MPDLMVKFRDTASAAARKEVIRDFAARFPGSAFAPLFETDDGDPELTSLFVLKLPAGSSIDEVTRQLSASPSIEYVHQPQARKPQN